MKRCHFVWGPGGVGKSHVSIRRAAENSPDSLLITLDPSPRAFQLLGFEEAKGENPVRLGEYRFEIKATETEKLFEELNRHEPAQEHIRWYFRELVEGLQRFRDYLALIQLAYEIQNDRHQIIVIDTPPFQEAIGLHQSIFTLKEFFERSLVQFAMKNSWIQLGVKKVVELARLFVGKKAVEEALGFLDWLNLHQKRFQKAAEFLQDLVFSEHSTHEVVLTPETSPRYLPHIQEFFLKTSYLHFLINRSSWNFDIPSNLGSFTQEFLWYQQAERALLQHIEKHFLASKIDRIPMMMMGQDTEEELLHFIKT